ncbi:hypothetical protein D3C76_1426200 [compost metagenome]
MSRTRNFPVTDSGIGRNGMLGTFTYSFSGVMTSGTAIVVVISPVSLTSSVASVCIGSFWKICLMLISAFLSMDNIAPTSGDSASAAPSTEKSKILI